MSSSSLASSVTSDEARKIINSLLLREHAKTFADYAAAGIAGGGIASGLGILAKTLSRQAAPPKSTFTTPVLSTVYVEDDKKTKKSASTPLPLPVNELAANDKYAMAAKALGLLAGIPIGVAGVGKLLDAGKAQTQQKHLNQLFSEYELALQDYAKSKNEPVQKVAQVAKPKSKMDRLVENIVKIAESPSLLGKLNQYLVAYAVGAPIVAGVLGFSDQWRNNRGKDLQAAELQLQANRERINPTYPVTSITRLPAGGGKKVEDIRDRLVEKSLNDVDTSYLD